MTSGIPQRKAQATNITGACARAVVCSLVALALTLQTAAVYAATNYDFGSKQNTIPSPAAGSIIVGGQVMNVKAGDLLTPAELAAINQVQRSGHQSIVVSGLGNAAGGRVNVGSDIARNVGNLVIPKGLTAVDNFASTRSLSMSGDLINSGWLYAYSTSAAIRTALISAENIFNKQGGVISSSVPRDGSYLGAIPHFNLTLSAVDSIVNCGTIFSSGVLNLSAGNQIINGVPQATTAPAPLIQAASTINVNAPIISNEGKIVALTGDINLASKVAQSVVVSGAGTYQALKGNINVRSARYSGSADTAVLGGDYLSKTLNLYGGNGVLNLNVGNVTGTVTSKGLTESIVANTPVLSLGRINILGDPTYYNTGGDIKITGNITVGESLAIVALNDVRNTASTVITARSGGQGQRILIVGGADFGCSGCGVVSGGGNSSTLSGTPPSGGLNSGGTITFGAGDGRVRLNSGTVVINANSTGAGMNGADVIIAAFGVGGKGDIDLSAATINTTGGSGGNPGNVTVIGGRSGGSGVMIGNINASGGSSGGVVTVGTYTPAFSSGSTMTLDSTGSITSGNTIVAGAPICCSGGGEAVEIVGTVQANQVTLSASRDVIMDTTSRVNVGTNTVVVQNINTGPTNTSIGGTTNTFNLNSTDLTHFTAGTLQVGSTVLPSSVTLESNQNLGTLGYDLSVQSSTGNYTQNAGTTLTLGSHQFSTNVGGTVTTNTISSTAGGGGSVNLIGGTITTAGAMTADKVTMATTNSGNITVGANITGNGSATTNGISLTTDGSGNVTVNSGATISETMSGAPMTITTNDVALNGNLSSPGNTINVTVNGNKTIDVGAAGTGSLVFDNSELGRVSAGTLVIGDKTSAGNIRTAGSFDLTGRNYILWLQSSGTYSQSAGATITMGGASMVIDTIDTATTGTITGGTTGSRVTVNSAASGNAVLVNGNISADTVSLNAVTNNASIVIGSTNSATVTATGASGLSISTLGSGGLTMGNGSGVNGSINDSATNTPVDIKVNNIAINSGSSINAGTGTVTIRPNAAGTSIGVAGAAGVLNLTSAELASITAGELRIGDITLNCDVAVGGPIDLTGSGAGHYNLTFNTLGTYGASGSTITIGAHTLTVNASSILTGAVATGSNGTASFTASSGDVNMTGNINVGSSGTANLSASGSVIGAATVTGGTVNLSATSGNIGSSWAPINTAAGTLNLSTANSAYITETDNVTVSATPMTGTLDIVSNGGSITTSGALFAGTINLQSYSTTATLTANGSITSTGNMTLLVHNVVLSNGLTSGGNITVWTSHLTDNGAITSSGANAQIILRGAFQTQTISYNTDLTVDGAVGPITTTGGGSTRIDIQATDGLLTLNSSMSLDAGTAGQIGLLGGARMNIGSGVTISVANTPTTLTTPILSLGSGSTLASTLASGTGWNLFTRSSFQMILPDSGAATISTGGANIAITALSTQFSKTSGSSTATINLNGGPATIEASTSGTTIDSSVIVKSNSNLALHVAHGDLTDNGTITSTAAGGTITIDGHGFNLSGTPGTIAVTGGGASAIYVHGYDGGVNFNSSYTFDPGASGTVSIDSFPGIYGSGTINLRNGSALSVPGGGALNINAPALSLSAGSGISVAKNSGTALSISSYWTQLDISAAAGSTISFTTGGGNIVIGPQGGGNALTLRDAGGTFNFVTAGGSTSFSSVAANLAVGGSLTLSSANNLVFNVAGASLVNAGSVISTGGSITVNGSGIMSVTGAGTMSAGTLNLSSDSTISVTQSALTGTVTGSAIGNYSVQVNGSGGLTVGNITSSDGSVSLIANGGELLVQAGKIINAGQGNVQIQNLSTSGTIFLDTGSTVQAFCSNSLSKGITTIGIGPLPLGSPVAGSTPAGVTVVTAGAGLAYFGANGITANGTNVVNAIGRNMIFDTGSAGSVPSTAITLNGGVTVTSDPPVMLPNGQWAHPVSAAQLIASQANAGKGQTVPVQTMSTTSANAAQIVDSADHNSAANLVVPDKAVQQNALAYVPSAAIQPSAKAMQGQFDGSDMASASMLYGYLDKNSVSPVSSATVGTDLIQTSIGGCVIHHAHAVLGSRIGRCQLNAGECIVAASSATTVESGKVTVSLKPGAIVLMERDGQTVKVRALYASGPDSVIASIDHHSLAIASGQEMICSPENHCDNGGVSKRHTQTVHTADGHVITCSEVSLISLVDHSHALAAVMHSQDPCHQQLSNRILKMAACLVLVTGSHGAYSGNR